MEDIFPFIFWSVIVFLWIILPLLRKRRLQPEEKIPPEIEEEILETLGFPIPKPPKTQAPLEEIIVPIQAKEEKVRPETETKPQTISLEIKEEEPEYLSVEKLQEGMILSIILGPPKAKTILSRRRNL